MEIGDKVRVKPVENKVLHVVFRGGEGTIERFVNDSVGEVVIVRMERSGRLRPCRPEHLIVHRKGK